MKKQKIKIQSKIRIELSKNVFIVKEDGRLLIMVLRMLTVPAVRNLTSD